MKSSQDFKDSSAATEPCSPWFSTKKRRKKTDLPHRDSRVGVIWDHDVSVSRIFSTLERRPIDSPANYVVGDPVAGAQLQRNRGLDVVEHVDAWATEFVGITLME